MISSRPGAHNRQHVIRAGLNGLILGRHNARVLWPQLAQQMPVVGVEERAGGAADDGGVGIGRVRGAE